MPTINLLFLNVGRRVELLQAFRAAFRKLGVAGTLIGTDVNGWATGLYEVDEARLLPHASSAAFPGALEALCTELSVDMIVPLIDPDLLPLAAHRQVFERNGRTRVLCSALETIERCRDKRVFYTWLQREGLPAAGVLSFDAAMAHPLPLFIKAVDGSASLHSVKVTTVDELQFFAGHVPNSLIQEFIEGDEITVDLFSDWHGKPLLACPRRRIKTRAGEVAVAVLERNSAVEELALTVAQRLRTIGPVNIQILRRATDQRLFVSEVNPRFGGGVPLSMAAGAPFPEWVIEMACDRAIPSGPVTLQDKLSMLRFDQSRFLPFEAVVRDHATSHPV